MPPSRLSLVLVVVAVLVVGSATPRLAERAA